MMISTTILGIWGYSEIFIYGNFYCLQNMSAEDLKLFPCLVRGCPFIKIWFNGSIRTMFTESYKIKQRLPHRPIRAPIFVYYS